MEPITSSVNKKKLLLFLKSKIALSRIAFVLAVSFIAISGISSYFVMNSKEQDKQSENIASDLTPSILPSRVTAEPTPTVKITDYATKAPVTPTSSVAVIHANIKTNNSTITDNSIEFTVRNNDTGQEQKVKNTNSSWTFTNITPGRYVMSITYPNDKFFNTERSCEGCQNKQDISNYGMCGYITDIIVGDNINLFCTLIASKPLVTQSAANPQDTTPPTTNIQYPQPNGSITYKIDGKVCAIATAPSDDSSPSEVETEYKFDEGNWSGYATGRGYLCADSLTNGSHSLSYHSKDKAGNVESTKILVFTVNISGN